MGDKQHNLARLLIISFASLTVLLLFVLFFFSFWFIVIFACVVVSAKALTRKA